MDAIQPVFPTVSLSHPPFQLAASTSLWTWRLAWIISIFVIALMGSFLPFLLSRGLSMRADSTVALCTAFTGSVCFAVGMFLSQEGAEQLGSYWGNSSSTLASTASIVAFVLMYCADFAGKALESVEPPGDPCLAASEDLLYLDIASIDAPQSLCSVDGVASAKQSEPQDYGWTPFDVPGQTRPQPLSAPLLLATVGSFGSQPGGTASRSRLPTVSRELYISDLPDGSMDHAVVRSLPPQDPTLLFHLSPHRHRHRCETIAMGEPDLFVESVYRSTGRRRRRSLRSVGKREDSLRDGVVSRDGVRHTTSSSATNGICDACCCDSDSDLAESSNPTSGLHLSMLSKRESNVMERALGWNRTLRHRSADTRVASTERSLSTPYHLCGGHSCSKVQYNSLMRRHCQGATEERTRQQDDDDRRILPSRQYSHHNENEISLLSSQNDKSNAPVVLEPIKSQELLLDHCPDQATDGPIPTDQSISIHPRHVFQSLYQPEQHHGSTTTISHDVGTMRLMIEQQQKLRFTQDPRRNVLASHVERSAVAVGTSASSTWVSSLLFLCFSFHSVVEGIGLGASSDFTTIGTGIALHKGLSGFAVGTSVMEAGLKPCHFLLAAVIFALMTPIGAIIGQVASSYDSNQMFTGIFTAMAGGTFIFISLIELIPKAFKKRKDSVYKMMGLLSGSVLVVVSEICRN